MTLFWQTVKNNLSALLIFLAVVAAINLMYIAILPDFQKEQDKFSQLAKAYPPELMKAFGVENPALIFSSLEAFLAMEQYSIIWPILVVIILAGWAGAALAGEVEKGTIELLLAQPISRFSVFLQKYLAGFLLLSIFVLLGNFSVIPLAGFFNLSYQAENWFVLSLLGLFFAGAIFSLAMFFSSLFSEKGKVYLATAGIFVFMYFIKIVANLRESLVNLKYLSFFHYFDVNTALVEGRLEVSSLLVFLLVILITTLTGLLIFHKRDIAV